MRKRLPESAKRFIALVEAGPMEQLVQEVHFVVTGSTHAFGGNLAILHREMLASGSHIRIFIALCLLHGLIPKEVFELYKRLPRERQEALDAMVKRAIAEEIADQNLRPQSLPVPGRPPVALPRITLSAEVEEMGSICHSLGIPPR